MAPARRKAAAKRSQGAKRRGVTHDWVRATALALPGVIEGRSYGTPAFRVGRQKGNDFICRFHQDGKSLVLLIDLDAREILLQADPESFYLTDHYRPWPAMLARLATVDRDALRDLLEDAWRRGGGEAEAKAGR
jgi:hypothetical protein